MNLTHMISSTRTAPTSEDGGAMFNRILNLLIAAHPEVSRTTLAEITLASIKARFASPAPPTASESLGRSARLVIATGRAAVHAARPGASDGERRAMKRTFDAAVIENEIVRERIQRRA